jgi:hypothetical protein
MLRKLHNALYRVFIALKVLCISFFKGTYKKKPLYHCLRFYFRTPGKKGFFTQIKEMATLAIHWEEFPYPYFEIAMFKQDCELTLDQMKKFVPQTIFDREVQKSHEYRPILENKSLFADLMEYYQIPQPELICKFFGGRFYDKQNKMLAQKQIDKLISELEYEKIFLKPTFGASGEGILCFVKGREEGYYDGEDRLTSDYLMEKYDQIPIILQAGIKQSRQLAAMNPDCVNSFRVLSRNNLGKICLLAANLKLGRKGTIVDNGSHGAISVRVDPQTGTLGIGMTFYDRRVYSVHPDTLVAFTGQRIEYWDDVRDIVLRAAEAFSALEYVGWDVALTDCGALIIEGNYDPSIYAHQVFGNGLSSEVFASKSHFG